MEIKIISMTEAGEDAIRTSYKEPLTRGSFIKKGLYHMASRAVGKQELTENPCTLHLKLTFLSKNPEFYVNTLQQIEKAMKDNGAIKDIDYKLEVID